MYIFVDFSVLKKKKFYIYGPRMVLVVSYIVVFFILVE